MNAVFRILCTGCLCLLASNGAVLAIEPDAPKTLISQEEALIIAVRQRIDQLPDTRDSGEISDRAALASFYASSGSAPLWVGGDGARPKARKIAAEIRKANMWGLDRSQFDLPDLAGKFSSNAALIDAELQMSLAILKYARHARGGRMDPKELSLAIDRTPPLKDPREVLEALHATATPAAYLRDLHPQHEQFKRLRAAYLAALEREANGRTIEPVPTTRKSKKKKHKGKRARRSKTKLSQRLLYNMEMWRWMPRDLGETYVWSNVPEFNVRVVRNGRVIHRERIVTGKIKNKTPIFSDHMETVVFHPFWGVPNSIKVKEILPSLVRGGNVLEKQNLKISYGGRQIDPYSVDWSRTDIRNYHVFQPPGSRNALGVVKFLFPNKHAVYMHDTPSKHLFKHKVRAYSHGCMRVRNPLKLAEVVLGQDKGWDRSKINSLVKSGPKNNQISLKKRVPVHVTYFTARVDDKGKTQLVNDIYGHEKLIQMGLDGKAHLIVKRKPNLDAERKRVVSNSGPRNSYSYRERDRSWLNAVFGN